MNNLAKVLSAHPIDDVIRARVLQALDQIEAEHDVKVLFACESGSRGWGFASPDSDYDVRFVYVQRLPWYLTVEAQRDVIELPISDELDVCGWELRKALQLRFTNSSSKSCRTLSAIRNTNGPKAMRTNSTNF